MVRALLGVVLALLFLWFAMANWTPVVMVFGNSEVVTRLPVVVLAAFLLAFVPMSLRYRWVRSRWQARLTRAGATPTAPLPGMAPDVHPCPPSLAQPIAAPPGA